MADEKKADCDSRSRQTATVELSPDERRRLARLGRVAVLLPVLLDVVLRMDGRVQTVAAGLLPAWTLMLLTWPLPSQVDGPPGANGLIWVAHLQSQPLHWLGENMYVPAVLGTMLLAARWLRDDLAAGSTTPWPVRRRETGAVVSTP